MRRSLAHPKEHRWSRGHKARGQGQGQGHKKISRPRPRTDPLEAKAKDQGHRRKCSPKKKALKKTFRPTQKKDLQKFFQAKKVFKNFFLGDLLLLKETKKNLFADFPQGFWRFPTKISTVQK